MAKVLWTQKQDMGPLPRVGHAMTYDAIRRRVVLFGGDSPGAMLFGDTWEWDGESWTQVQDIGPSARFFHALAFDNTRQRSVLFGGRNAAGLLGDTWEWDGENWTQVADSGPARRVGHAMAFDRNRNRIVLFGGDSAGRLSDTWEWDGNEWVQQGDTGPSARIHPAMAYDTARNRLVLFGGAAQDAGLGDTWEWDGNAWTEESDFGPDPCAGGAMVFKGSRVALFGGIASIASPPPQPAPPIFDRSWEWDGRHWTARQDMGPGDRVFHAMAFDEARSRVVLFGGSTVPTGGDGVQAGIRGDTWEQFEEGQATGGGPVQVELAAVEVVPNPAPAGVAVLITATLSGPTPSDASVLVLGNFMEIGTITIPAGQSSGNLELPIPVGEPAGTVTVTARMGTSEAETSLEILDAGGTVEVASVDAQPNPVPRGGTLVITVTLANPATEPAIVQLLIDGQEFAEGNIAIDVGATNGQLSIPIDAGAEPWTFELTARSGQTEASVQVTIQ
jgi:hypothetical protein